MTRLNGMNCEIVGWLATALALQNRLEMTWNNRDHSFTQRNFAIGPLQRSRTLNDVQDCDLLDRRKAWRDPRTDFVNGERLNLHAQAAEQVLGVGVERD